MPPLPVTATLGVVSGIVGAAEQRRIEAHIQDRVTKYASLPNDQLASIIATYGGEMGEAAKRVLASRGVSASSASIAPTASEAPKPSSPVIDTKTLLVLGGGALLLLFLLRR